MSTVDDVLKSNRGIGPGFDFLRLFLAFSIVIFHSLTVTDNYFNSPSLDDTPFWIVHYALVPMFFALSGFLISGSAGRLSLKNFLINRGMRIVPALAVDTLVCALIIGPVFTNIDLAQYFTSTKFLVFFLNVVGLVHFNLPGVFTTHPVAEVNGSLWTVPFEIICYCLISAMIFFKLVTTRIIIPCCVFGYILVSIVVGYSGLIHDVKGFGLEKLISVAFIEHEAQAVTGFLFGIIAYQNRDIIPYSRKIAFAAIAVVLGIAFALPSMAQGEVPVLRLILMPCICYITVFIGLTSVPLPKFLKTGDYSYGIYLYHQPFLQIVIALAPALALAHPTGWIFTFVVGLPMIVVVAGLSWHLVEKPLLAMRKRYSLMANLRDLEPKQSPAVPNLLHMKSATSD